MPSELAQNILFFVAGTGLVLYGAISLLRMRGYKKVDAICTDVSSDIFFAGGNSRNGCKRTFAYFYNGKWHIGSEKGFWGRNTRPGTNCKILISRTDPVQIRSFSEIRYHVLFLVSGIILDFLTIIRW